MSVLLNTVVLNTPNNFVEVFFNERLQVVEKRGIEPDEIKKHIRSFKRKKILDKNYKKKFCIRSDSQKEKRLERNMEYQICPRTA